MPDWYPNISFLINISNSWLDNPVSYEMFMLIAYTFLEIMEQNPMKKIRIANVSKRDMPTRPISNKLKYVSIDNKTLV